MNKSATLFLLLVVSGKGALVASLPINNHTIKVTKFKHVVRGIGISCFEDRGVDHTGAGSGTDRRGIGRGQLSSSDGHT